MQSNAAGRFVPLRRARALTTRERLELAIQKAIDLLDRHDAETEDMEEDDAAEDGGDDEPSLGAPENHHVHGLWCRGGDGDLEDDDGA